MNIMLEKVNLIKKLYPCIYQINEKCFYLGVDQFRECTQEEYLFYNEYITEWEYIMKNGGDKYVSTKKLISLFNKIMFRKDMNSEFIANNQAGSLDYDQQLNYVNHTFDSWIDTLSNENLESLSNQVKHLLDIDNYVNGGFHKLSSELQKILPEFIER